MKEFKNSLLIESYFYHRFMSDLILYSWVNNEYDIEILDTMIDKDGYDFVIIKNNIPAYIQTKSSKMEGTSFASTSFPINKKLFNKENSFVLLFGYSEEGDNILVDYFLSDLRNINSESLRENKNNRYFLPKNFIHVKGIKELMKYFFSNKNKEYIKE